MRPLDPRLVKHAQAVRTFLLLIAVIGTLMTVTTIAQAFLLGDLLAGVFHGEKSSAQIMRAVIFIAGIALGRSMLSWLSEITAYQASARTKQQLRQSAAEHITALGPIWVSSQRGSDIATTLMRGLDSLDVYFAKYLPQLILVVTIPLSVGVSIVTQDVLSGVIVALTVPLIPFFMILIGWFTQSQVDKQWRALQRLAGHFLDLINGLPTLKAFNRSRGQIEGLARIGDEYRTSTMSVLRVSFLSSLVLELISTVSVALVAVSIGLRLVNGNMQLREGLIVLILVPEVYLPLRNLGAQFHAMTEGLEAADSVLSILDEPLPAHSGTHKVSSPASITFDSVSVTYPGFDEPALNNFSAEFKRGYLNVVTGPSGVGKSTALTALMGFASLSHGSLRVDGVDLDDLDMSAWRTSISYLPQSPWLPIGTVRDAINIENKFPDSDLLSACKSVGLALDDAQQFPAGLSTVINVSAGASTGQRRRIALARTLLMDRDIVILDEPSAAVDSNTENIITQVLEDLVARGRLVIVVAHRPQMISAGNNIIRLDEQVSAS